MRVIFLSWYTKDTSGEERREGAGNAVMTEVHWDSGDTLALSTVVLQGQVNSEPQADIWNLSAAP